MLILMKTALITGASYGIGAAITESLLGADWKVYGVSRSKPTFESKNFTWLPCDLSNFAQLRGCVADIAEPILDAFISNAGVIEIEMASAVTEQSYSRTFSVNVLAPMLLVHELGGKLTNATIVTVSSVSDRIPEADIALYCSSKAANTSYFNALAQELPNARIYGILPDYVDTPMLHSTMDGENNFNWSTTIKPQDIAELCMGLISDSPKLASGSNIIVVTKALQNDLKSVEKLYSYTTDSDKKLAKLY